MLVQVEFSSLELEQYKYATPEFEIVAQIEVEYTANELVEDYKSLNIFSRTHGLLDVSKSDYNYIKSIINKNITYNASIIEHCASSKSQNEAKRNFLFTNEF